jgi:hypothetical protein
MSPKAVSSNRLFEIDYKLNENETELPKELAQSLATMASPRDVRLWSIRFSDILVSNELSGETVLDLGLGEKVGMKWEEGTEHLKHKNFEELYAMLGLSGTNRIPGMVEEVETLGVLNQWDDEEAWSQSAKTPFSLSWFQLTGIIRMMEVAFEHESMLVGDEVGMGKTLETIGFLLTLQYFRRYWEKHQDFPGIWGEYIYIERAAGPNV